MTRATGTLPPPLRAVIAGVVAAGLVAAVAAAVLGATHVEQPWRWALALVCLVGVVLAERFPVKIGPEQKINLGALPCLVAALLTPALVGPPAVAAGMLLGNRWMHRTW